MRHYGRICDWNEQRGFGFIEPEGGGRRVFAHVTDFPPKPRAPRAGDVVSYATRIDERGRERAAAGLLTNAEPALQAAYDRQGIREAAKRPARPPRSTGTPGGTFLRRFIPVTIIFVGVALFQAFQHQGPDKSETYAGNEAAPEALLAAPIPSSSGSSGVTYDAPTARHHLPASSEPSGAIHGVPAAVPAAPLPASAYQCDGRTRCSQMHSCAEATYFLQNCPNTKMDGNGDGVPCESQWCTSP